MKIRDIQSEVAYYLVYSSTTSVFHLLNSDVRKNKNLAFFGRDTAIMIYNTTFTDLTNLANPLLTYFQHTIVGAHLIFENTRFE